MAGGYVNTNDPILANFINASIRPLQYLLYQGDQPRWEDPEYFLSEPDMENTPIAVCERFTLDAPEHNLDSGFILLEEYSWPTSQRWQFLDLFRYMNVYLSLYIFDREGRTIGYYSFPVTNALETPDRKLQLCVEYITEVITCENIWRYDEKAWETWKTNTPKKNWWAGLTKEEQRQRFDANLNYSTFNRLNRPNQAWPHRQGWRLDCAHISDEQTLLWAVGEMLFGPNICAPDSVSKAALRLFKNKWPYHERRICLDNLDGLGLQGGVETLGELLQAGRYEVELFEAIR